MLDLRRLSTFREVIRLRSFSAAAEALDYTQSSVSQQIATLEREVGATLIHRGSRPVAPTAVGRLLLGHAETLLDQAAAVEQEIATLARGESGSVRIAGFYTAWATFLPDAVAEVSRSRPDVTLELAQMEPEPALRGVRVGDLDVAVVYRFTPAGDDDRLTWTHLLDDPYAIALPAGHAQAAHHEVPLGDLAGERWVSPPREDPYTQLLTGLCRELGGFEPDVIYETGDIAMAQPLVAAGLAVALLPALGLVPRHAGVTVRPVRGTPPARSVWAVTRARERAQAVEATVETLVRAASRRGWAPTG